MNAPVCARLLVAPFVLIMVAVSGCNRPAAKPAPAPDRQALDRQRNALGMAFNNNDARALAALFAEDAEYIEYTGDVYRGPAAIENFFAKLYADNPGMRGTQERTTERFIAPEIFLEDSKWQVALRKDGGIAQGHATYLWVHRDGRWLIATARAWVPAQPPKVAQP